MTNNEPIGMDRQRYKNMLRRTAEEVKRYSQSMKIGKALLSVLVVLAVIGYIVSVLYMRTGSFTVNLDKFEATKYSLSLSERPYNGDKTMLNGMTSNLNADICEYITCIDPDKEIPADVDKIDGVHNGENYIAYSFYLVNAGEYDVTYQYTINIKNITNNLDSAIRVRLYTGDDGVYTFAKTASDGSGPEPGTIEFISNTIVAEDREDAFLAGQSKRYTIVIWLQGDDPDCLDPLIGGSLKLDMQIKVVY